MERPSKEEEQSLERGRKILTALEREISVLLRRSTRPLWLDGQVEGLLDRWTYALLVRLAEEGPLRVGEVARRFGIDKSTASRHLGRLEEQGMVSAMPDMRDARSALLRVTPEGKACLEESRETRLRPLRRVFATWDEEEQSELSRLLARLNAELDQLDGA